MGGPEVEHLIALLARLPGLGPRSARRAALKMLQEPEKRMLPLAVALADAARAVKPCADCGNLDSQDPCSICADPGRDRSIICVVEGVGDLWALERALVHRGPFNEAMTWLEIHGRAPQVLEHWKGFLEGTVLPQEGAGADQPRRRRRRRGRRRRHPSP